MNESTSQLPQHRPEPRPYADDEISLVDLTLILVKRWKLMTGVFLAIVLIALIFAFSMGRSYEYVSIYRVAEQAEGNDVGTLENPANIVARIDSYYADLATRQVLEEEGSQTLGFELSAESPENTKFVNLTSEASEDDAERVKGLHDIILNAVLEDQDALLEQRRTSLESQLESTKEALETAKQSSTPYGTDLVATYGQQVIRLEQQISYLHEGEIERVATQSIQPAGTSKALILALAIVLGGMLAVIAAFMMEFASAVCRKLKSD
ncbi:Wzz/FepE/Etk N-terminal domain-containing protein [Halomonas sp. V046]|uniref:Wzz/FepE/Etk N-terminal domain-containing protein n=1 Tax=Halomonas sp. V046 TaxID=3459611 RepID=UPI0040448BB9